MYKKILSEPLRFPSDMGSDARDILRGLLTRDPSQRLGVNGAEEIKRHPFFAKHIDWRTLLQKKIQPPFKPSVVGIAIVLLAHAQAPADCVPFIAQTSAIDCSNFDTEFTSEAPQDSVVEGSNLSQSVQGEFPARAQQPDPGSGNPLTYVPGLYRTLCWLHLYSRTGTSLGKRPEQRDDVDCAVFCARVHSSSVFYLPSLHSVSIRIISAPSATPATCGAGLTDSVLRADLRRQN